MMSAAITALSVHGAYVLATPILSDTRGDFLVTFNQADLASLGLTTHVEQINLVANPRRGTLRGLHYQIAPYEEVKTIRVVQGTIYDVLVDVRPSSPTRGQWCSVTLTSGIGQTLYLPAGVAHGYLTLTDDAQVCYTTSCAYMPKHAKGIRWNDPLFAITWPMREPLLINDRDKYYADFKWE